MALFSGEGCFGPEWQTYQPNLSFLLNETHNIKHAQLRDEAGNISACIPITIIKDQTEPEGTLDLSLNSGTIIPGKSPLITWGGDLEDPESGPHKVKIDLYESGGENPVFSEETLFLNGSHQITAFSNFKYATTYVIKVTVLNKVNLGVSAEAQFFSGFNTPTTITTSSIDAAYLNLEILPEGDALVIWSEIYSTRFQVTSQRFWRIYKSWSTPKRVSSSSDQSRYSRVVNDKKGNIFVVWIDTWASTYNAPVFFSRYNSGTNSWTPPLKIGDGIDSRDYSHDHAQISLHDDGGIFVAWITNKQDIAYNYFDPGKEGGAGWIGMTTAIDDDLTTTDIALASEGSATVLVWNDGSGPSSIKLTRFKNGAFSEAKTLSNSNYEQFIPRAHIIDSRIFVSWYAKHAISSYATNQYREVNLNTLQVSSLELPSVDFTGNSHAFSALKFKDQIFSFRKQSSKFGRIDYLPAVSRIVDGVWTNAETLGKNQIMIVNADVGAAASATNMIVFAECQGSDYSRHVFTHFYHNNTWSPAVIIDKGNGSAAFSPQIKFNQFNEAYAVWANSHNEINFATMGVK